MSFKRSIEIDTGRTIDFMGEDLRVYATPAMVMDIEQACCDLLLEHSAPHEDSVGVRVEVDHFGATLMGQTVEVHARVAEIEGPRVNFHVTVHDAVEQVSRGRHVRFIIGKEQLKKRLQAKAAKAERGSESPGDSPAWVRSAGPRLLLPVCRPA